MAKTESAQIVSFVAGATFASTDLYKLVHLTTAGFAIIATSSDTLPIGSLYGRTSSTSSTGVEVVPVAIGGIIKVRMASSTKHVRNWIAGSSDGFGIAITSELSPFGQIVAGASGGSGRIVSVLVSRFTRSTASVLAGG